MGVILVILLLIPLLLLLFFRLEGEKPTITTNLDNDYLGISQPLLVSIADQKSGVREVRVSLIGDNREVDLVREHVAGGGLLLGGGQRVVDFQRTIEPKKLGLAEGTATLKVTARDLSWRGWLHGNKTVIEKKIKIDFKPPVITVLTKAHNINQGGSGLVIYEVSEACPISGVQVEDQFYPGKAGVVEKTTVLAAFFALGHDQDTNSRIFIKATDRAGNTTKAGFTKYLKKKRFKKDSIKITDQFLETKMPEFDATGSDPSVNPLLAKFINVNNDIRKTNTGKIRQVTSTSEPAILWKGAFLRMANSKRMAGFADHRSYFYEDRKIDEQTHLGIDLAAFSRDKVTASNRGKVVFADALGIYGQTVIIDHGFGLFSMYSHLSRVDVQPGRLVEKNEGIGLTGSTGMAGGDHLHFSMLVHHTFVNPVEWWDDSWIKNNITSKIEEIQSAMP